MTIDINAAWAAYALEARLRAIVEVSPFAAAEDRDAQRARAEEAFRTFATGFLEVCHKRPAAVPVREVREAYLLGLLSARQIARDYRVDEALQHAEPGGAAAAARAIDLKITDLMEEAANGV